MAACGCRCRCRRSPCTCPTITFNSRSLHCKISTCSQRSMSPPFPSCHHTLFCVVLLLRDTRSNACSPAQTLMHLVSSTDLSLIPLCSVSLCPTLQTLVTYLGSEDVLDGVLSESLSHHQRHKHKRKHRRSIRAVGGGEGSRDATAGAEGADGSRRSSTYWNRIRKGHESVSDSAVDTVDVMTLVGTSRVSGERE